MSAVIRVRIVCDHPLGEDTFCGAETSEHRGHDALEKARKEAASQGWVTRPREGAEDRPELSEDFCGTHPPEAGESR